MDWRLLVKDIIAKLRIFVELLDSFYVNIFVFWGVNWLVFQEEKDSLSWQTSLLCIVVDLSGGGTVAEDYFSEF